MSCYYCAQEGLKIDDRAKCPYCYADFCTAPSGRWDGDFHGEECGCDCGVLICERHLQDHARDAGHPNPADCFPALWAVVSRSGLGGAAAALGDGTDRTDVATGPMSRFLNLVVPRDSLTDLATSLPDTFAVLREDEAGPYVAFGRGFFVAGTVERTAALAARELDRAMRGLERHPERVRWVAERVRAQRHTPAAGVMRHSVDRLLSYVDGFLWRNLEGVYREPPPFTQMEDFAAITQVLERNRDVLKVERAGLATWLAAAHATGAEPEYA